MRFRNRSIGSVLVLVAGIGLIYGCQTRDGSIPTEADRSIQAAGEVEDHIFGLIDGLFDPALGKSVRKSFSSIVSDLQKNKVAVAQSKTLTLIDFILKHYQDGNLIAQADLSTKVGTLNLELLQYVGLIPDVEDAAAAACLPGDPVACEAFPQDGLAEIPGELITQPFTLIVFEVDCSELDPGINWVAPCYEVQTVPEQTFATNTSSSLSLSQSGDIPIVGVCADLADGLDPGIDVFLYHAHDGVIELTPFENISVCEELASRWANPILATFQPVLDMLGPQPLYAAALAVGSVAGGINNFSTLFACEPGCLPTTTTLAVLNGSTLDNSFVDGEAITLEATVTPSPIDTQDPRGLFVIRNGTSGPLVVHEDQVVISGGTATFTVVCGDDVPHSSTLAAFAGFYGTVSHETSFSPFSTFSCSAD